MYVLIRNDGYFVAPPGEEHSYTGKLQCARLFETKEEAERERCVENESVAQLINQNGRLVLA